MFTKVNVKKNLMNSQGFLVKETWNYAHKIVGKWRHHLEVYSKPSQTSRIELFAKLINSWKPITISRKKLHFSIMSDRILHAPLSWVFC